MKAILLVAMISAAPAALARYSTLYQCDLASGYDSLQTFQMYNDGGAVVRINGIRMRDTYPRSPYGIWHSPQMPDYWFTPRPSSPGPSIDVLKRDGSRPIYHCIRLN